MVPLQRKPWAAKFALVLLLCFLPIAVGICSWFASLRDRKWSAFIARLDELRAQSEHPAPARLSFDRELHPGNAWDDYILAQPWRPGRPPVLIRIAPFIERRPEADRAEAESLVARYAASIELISSGARRRDAGLSGLKVEAVGQSAYDVARLCIAKARFLSEAGYTSDALELLADVCMYGGDIAHTGRGRDGSTGLNVLRIAFWEMRDMVQSREIAEADLLKLDHRLQKLDEGFPDAADDVRNDLLELGSLILREDQSGEMHHHVPGRTRRRWRYLFSSRLQAASAFSIADQLVHRALEARKLPFREEQRVAQAISRDQEASNEPLLGTLSSLAGYQTIRWTRADLRLLRFAVHYRVTGETLDLDSPFGKKIQSQFTEGSLLAWHPTMFNQPPKSGPTKYVFPYTIEVPRRPAK